VHYNLLNGLFLDDLIKMFSRKAGSGLTQKKHFQIQFFRKPKVLPAGESILWALAKATENSTVR
jgi:hypothetical protein